jgi:mannosylglycoprotein endo-beta-mannosidase
LPDSSGKYSGLQTIKQAQIKAKIRNISEGKVEVFISNPVNGPIAFFNRVSLIDVKSKKRILPVFYSDNYISVLPGESKTVTLEYSPSIVKEKASISIKGWNVKEMLLPVR